MGLFDNLFGRRPKPRGEYKGEFKLLNAYEPRFSRWSGSIYENQLVRAAINARAVHISKLAIDIQGSAKQALVNKLKKAPNAFQTWSQFLYKLSTILDIHNTAFILPVFGEYGEVTGIYCPLPSKCTVVQFGKTLYLNYVFRDNNSAAIELENCGIMTKFQYANDMLGENNSALFPTMELINIQNQGIEEGVKSAASYRFMAQLSNFSKASDIAKERKRFTEENFSREAEAGGLLLFPNTYQNIQQISAKPWIVDADQVKEIQRNVFEYFGVNEDVLENKAYGDSWSAFYEGAIEPFAIQFSEVLTKMLFTMKEQTMGNMVMATSNRLQYLSNRDKLDVSAQLLDRGIISINDAREIWNMPPVEGGDARIIRGEYYTTDEKIGDENGNERDPQL